MLNPVSQLRETHIAIYGNTRVLRVYNERDQGFTIEPITDRTPSNLKMVRMSDPVNKRAKPSGAFQRAQRRRQNDCCFYCSRAFGSTVYDGQEKIRLKIAWDHLVPFVYSNNNKDENFVAACHVCNSFKSDILFDDVSEARDYLRCKWETHGITTKPTYIN